MSATKPEKCPRCGCVEIADSKIGTHFACHTLRFSDDGIVQSLMCAMNQRDQLEAKVGLLTAAGQDAMDFIDGIHREYSRVIEGWEKATK